MEDKESLPKHIGIIMDGNGRWAEKKGLSRSAGHKAGSENLKKLLYHMFDKQIQCVSLYAFSTENFKRAKEEVEYLMGLFIYYFNKELKSLKKLQVKILFSGRKEQLPEKVVAAMNKLEKDTEKYNKGILNICLNYGGQYEIVDMTKQVVELVLNGSLALEDISKEVVEKNLYQLLPELDFVIRTSGEQRSSNFMIYQSAYAEYYFPDVFFPDFNEEEFDQAIVEYKKRKRRFGGTS